MGTEYRRFSAPVGDKTVAAIVALCGRINRQPWQGESAGHWLCGGTSSRDSRVEFYMLLNRAGWNTPPPEAAPGLWIYEAADFDQIGPVTEL